MPGFELFGEEELQEVRSVFENGGVLFRHGFEAQRGGCYKVRDFERAFGDTFGVDYSLAVTSGTAAIRVALAAIGIKEGDEVITQSFTFVATVEAIIESRGTPVCTQIDQTLNMDPADLIKRITPKTKAVVVVHMLGVPAKMPEICAICKKYNLILIEDVAWGCGGSLNDRMLGTWGDIGTFSFDYAKTITTGEGGMLIFQNEIHYQKAFAWHDHGHENNPLLPRWEDSRVCSGFNFRMMELQGAIGIAQLKKLKRIIEFQRKNRDLIWNKIKRIKGISLREIPIGSYDTADALIIFVPNARLAKECRRSLMSSGISTKILPEAYTWHFAGTWDHMPELAKAHNNNLKDDLNDSHNILSCAVSIPIKIKLEEDSPEKIYLALQVILESTG